jgi:hypothetical protein
MNIMTSAASVQAARSTPSGTRSATMERDHRTRSRRLSSFYMFLAFPVALCTGRAALGCDLFAHFGTVKPAITSSVAKPASPTTAPTADWSGDETGAITGYWLIVDTYDGSVTDERFDNYFADHNEVFMDQSSPPTGNACNGTWRQSGLHEFKLLHKAWVFDSTNTFPIGSFALRATITVSDDARSLSGTETGTVYDLNGNVLTVYGPFDISGNRIRVDF